MADPTPIRPIATLPEALTHPTPQGKAPTNKPPISPGRTPGTARSLSAPTGASFDPPDDTRLRTAFQAAARKHAKAALAALAHLMENGRDERVRATAAARILDIAFGRPSTPPPTPDPPAPIQLIPGDDKL